VSLFDQPLSEGRPALVGYLPAGFPTVAGGIEAVTAMIDAGVDLVELGLPYSDPVIDGPVIQRATERALSNGVRTRDVLATVDAVSGLGVPVVVMTYWNPVDRYGVDAFARDLAGAGGAGLVTPDLIPDEADEWLAASDEHKLDRIFLVSPSSTDERIAMTVGLCRGFVYATAVMGVTGARDDVSSAAPMLVSRVRAVAGRPGDNPPGGGSQVPVGVGLGVRDGRQAATVGAYADGVIVGSALVQAVADDPSLRTLRNLVGDLAGGVRAARS
jgi:tryptophan synthase alpha chain